MATQSSFSAEEWNLLRIAPALVASGVSASDPGGLVGAFQEAAAGVQGMVQSLKQDEALELASAILADKSAPKMPSPTALMGEGSRDQQLANFKSQAVSQVKAALALLESKASPAELTAYKGMLITVAEKTAHAAKEGGFLGFGGERVSADEKMFLDQLRSMLQGSA